MLARALTILPGNPDVSMTEEEKKAAEEAEAERQANLSPEEKEAEAKAKLEKNIDYEAEAKREKERADKAEATLAEKAFKSRKDKREEPESDDEEDKPLSRRELLGVLEERDKHTTKIIQESTALEIARKHTSSEVEAQAALLFWKNRVVPTGNLEEDVKFAVGGLNHSRTIAQNEELKRALRSKETKSDNAAGDHRDAPQGSEPQSSSDISAIKGAGFKWDGTARLYTKPLTGGKKLMYDPKTKKRWVLK